VLYGIINNWVVPADGGFGWKLTSDGSSVSDTDATHVVKGLRGDLAGAPGPVLVVAVVARRWVRIVVVDIPAGQRILQHDESSVNSPRGYQT